MTRDDLLGVWTLTSATRGGAPLGTGQTHLVVHADQLWELWPDATYYEGVPGPEHGYGFEAGSPARLRVQVPRGEFCYLVERDGDTLRLRLGDVFGSFPRSIDDEAGNLYTYARETETRAAELSRPIARLPRARATHPALGELTFDANLDWWRTRRSIGGFEIGVDITVDPSVDPTPALDRAATMVARLDPAALAAFAAAELLELHNDSWRDEAEDGPPIDAATFAARLIPSSLTIDLDGTGATMWFDDGGLFWGHTVHVGLDAELQPTDAYFSG